MKRLRGLLVGLAAIVGFAIGSIPPMVEMACSISVPSGGSIQSAVDARPAGATICLSGTYTLGSTVAPKAGQKLVGPAAIVAAPGVEIGFESHDRNEYIDLDVSGFDDLGIRFTGDDDVRIVGGRYHHNAGNGMGGGLAQVGSVFIDGVEIDHNGSTAGLGIGSSGVKFAGSNGSVIQNSFVHDNVGNGIWFDIDSANDAAMNNVVTGNTRRGIFYEVSRGPALIAGNTVQGNNLEGLPGGSGIGVSSSRNVTIEDNVLGGNRSWGIRANAIDRGYPLSNVIIRNNDLNGDRAYGCGSFGVACSDDL